MSLQFGFKGCLSKAFIAARLSVGVGVVTDDHVVYFIDSSSSCLLNLKKYFHVTKLASVGFLGILDFSVLRQTA